MASIKKKSGGGGGGANWMDTYGDMVTLLLCFFVLLYSISTIEQDKWMIFVKSFNRDAIDEIEPVNPGPMDVSDGSGGTNNPVPDDNNEVDEALEQLYDFLVEYQASSAAAAENVSVSKGDGYVFISFNDSVFFDGNSSVLRPDGKAVLDTIIPALVEASPYIDELKVLGHTAQMYADRPNPNVAGDRHLASDRATEVIIYLQNHIPHETLHPGRLVVESFGQWRNIAPNDVEANRAKNRRVEMVISGRDLEEKMNNEFDSYFGIYDTPDQSGTIPSYTTSD